MAKATDGVLWTVSLADDSSPEDTHCGPSKPFDITFHAPTGGRPVDAASDANVRADGTARLVFDDKRGGLDVRAFLLDRGGKAELWLERDEAGTYISARFELSAPAPPTTATGTFLFGVRGDCVAVGRTCRCIVASRLVARGER